MMKYFLPILLLFAGNSLPAQNLQRISDDLYQAMGELQRDRPTASFSDKASVPASFSADGKQLWVSPKVKEVCLRYQTDEDNVAMEDIALASIIGEVVYRHFTGEAASEKATMSGLLLAHMAGYPAADIAYSAWSKLDGVPNEEEHLQWIRNGMRTVSDLSQVFQTAQYALVTEHYQEAGACYEYILSKGFKSREIYNNAGATLLLYCMDKAGATSPLYPINIDVSSQLDRSARRAWGGTTKAMLNQSLRFFAEATKRDPKYSSAYINHACALAMLGEDEPSFLADAFSKASRGYREAINQENAALQAKALLTQGIIRMLEGNSEEAKDLMSRAKEKDGKLSLSIMQNKALLYIYQLPENQRADAWKEVKNYANSNDEMTHKSLIGRGNSMQTLLSENLTRYLKTPANTEIENTTAEEQVNGLPMRRVRSESYAKTKQDIALNQQLLIKANNEETSNLLYLYKNNTRVLVAYGTKSNYKSPSARGIGIGSAIGEVFKVYGHTQERPLGLSNTKVFSYPKTGISFFVNRQNKVSGWVIY